MSYILSLKTSVGTNRQYYSFSQKPFRKNVRGFFGKTRWEKSKVIPVYQVKLLGKQGETS
jgi:hypothetical protein